MVGVVTDVTPAPIQIGFANVEDYLVWCGLTGIIEFDAFPAFGL